MRSSTKNVLKNKWLGEACNRVEREEWPANSGGCLQATGMTGSLNVNKEVLGPVGVAASVRALVSKAVVSTLEVRAEGVLLNPYPTEWEPRASLSEMWELFSCL